MNKASKLNWPGIANKDIRFIEYNQSCFDITKALGFDGMTEPRKIERLPGKLMMPIT